MITQHAHKPDLDSANDLLCELGITDDDDQQAPEKISTVEAGAVATDDDPRGMKDDKPVFRAITMSELMSSDYLINFLCKQVLAEGQPTIVGGPHKAFKTSAALELAVCLATGTQFLNHFDVPMAVKVCFFSGEGGMGVIQDTLRRIGKAKDIDIAAIKNLLMTDRVPRLDNVDHLCKVKAYLEKHTPNVAFFDPLYLAMSGADTANVFSMGERLRVLNELCMPLGVTPVLLHHLKHGRTNHFVPAGLEDLSMAGFAEYAAQWILLSRRTVYDPDDPTHRLWVSFGGRAGHASAWGLDIHEGSIDDPGGRVWETELRRQDDVRAETTSQKAQKQAALNQAKQTEFEALCNRAVTWIAGKPEGITKRKLRAFLRVGDDKAEQVITHLEEDGRIESFEGEAKTKNAKRKVTCFRVIVSEDDKTLFD